MFRQLLSDQPGVKYEAIDGFFQTSDEREIFARAFLLTAEWSEAVVRATEAPSQRFNEPYVSG